MSAVDARIAALEKQLAAQARQISELLALVAPVQARQPQSIAQQAICLAKQGRIEESKALLRSQSSRRKAA
jgi:uncharacterized coiled-coil protein SlyX